MKKEKDFAKDFSKELISRMVAKDSTSTMFAYQPVRPRQEKDCNKHSEITNVDDVKNI